LPLNLRSSVLSVVGREGIQPSYRRAASLPRPFGLIPTKPAVLGAANENVTTLQHYIKYYIISSLINYQTFQTIALGDVLLKHRHIAGLFNVQVIMVTIN